MIEFNDTARPGVADMRERLFAQILSGFDAHAIRLGRIMGDYAAEMGKLIPKISEARRQPDTGMLTIPVPIRYAGADLPGALFSVWLFPGELRTGLLLPSEFEATWDGASPTESFPCALEDIWPPVAHAVPGATPNPSFSVHRKQYSGAKGAMYDWRFYGEYLNFTAWVEAIRDPDSAGAVWAEAIEARVRHLWFSLAGVMVRAGFGNTLGEHVVTDEWFLAVRGAHQPGVVERALGTLNARVEYAAPRSEHNWSYVIICPTNPHAITAMLGEEYHVDVRAMPQGEQVSI